MERYLSITIRTWIAIHAAFLFIQILYTFAFMDGTLPTRTETLFDHIAGNVSDNSRGASPDTSAAFNKIQVDLESNNFGFSEDDTESEFFLAKILCRIGYIGVAFRLLYGLFTLNYPFISVIENEAAQYGDSAGTVIWWMIQVIVWAGIISGLVFTVRIGQMAIQSGIIGAVFGAAIRNPVAGGLAAAATAAFGSIVSIPGAQDLLSKVLGCG